MLRYCLLATFAHVGIMQTILRSIGMRKHVATENRHWPRLMFTSIDKLFTWPQELVLLTITFGARIISATSSRAEYGVDEEYVTENTQADVFMLLGISSPVDGKSLFL